MRVSPSLDWLVNNIRTVSDTKRAFYSLHTRPINSIYRRVVEELMVEMHLLGVNIDFQSDPIYRLGVVTAFDCFMQGYTPERDKESIFNAVIQAQGEDPQRYRSEAQRLGELAKNLTLKDLLSEIEQSTQSSFGGELQGYFQAIATNPNFKYSRLFAIGLFSLIEQAEPSIVTDKTLREQTLEQISNALKLPQDKLLKDLDLYRSNLEKVSQARLMMDELTQAERKKREQRSAGVVATPTNSSGQSASDA